jgi:DNA replication and repair protein RecF
MNLSRIDLLNFRNHEELSMEFSPGINSITGMNGAGKTAVLDAVYYLANCKSYFNILDAQIMQRDKDFFSVKGMFSHHEKTEEIVCHFSGKGRKTVKRNGKTYERLIDHLGLIQVVVITPYDIEMVLGISEDRRRFIDQTLCQTDRNYLAELMRYRNLHEQRNSLLKSGPNPDPIVLESIDGRLAPSGNRLFEMRKAFCEQFIPVFRQAYLHFSGDAELPDIKYVSDLEKGNMDDLLFANRSRDLILQRTSSGPHRDDLSFLLNEQALKRYGSQGQIKSFVIALKLAQYHYFREKTGELPILLLDDIFEKIDARRAQDLMELVTGSGYGQIIITDTHRERVDLHLQTLEAAQKHFKL